ncbi:PDGLE domain-containing protein, partial [Streptomyces sp. MCAF7]
APAAAPAARRSARRVWAIGVAAALLCAGVVSFYASASPDGLEKVAHDNGIDKKTEDHASKDSPLADYGVKDISDARLSGGLAGVIGVGATLAVGSGLFIVVRRRAKKAAVTPVGHDPEAV